jgi:hypothetical protein
MNHLFIIEQLHAKTFDFLPFVLTPLSFPGTRLRPCGRMGAIDANHQNRTTESAFGKLLDCTMNFRSIRTNIQQLNIGCDIVDHIVNMVVAQLNTRTPFKGFANGFIWHFGCQPRFEFLDIRLHLPGAKPQRIIQGIKTE